MWLQQWGEVNIDLLLKTVRQGIADRPVAAFNTDDIGMLCDAVEEQRREIERLKSENAELRAYA